ncbi:hypothetical protein U1Q18_037807 [Sarracenia purpurea var. burkii]
MVNFSLKEGTETGDDEAESEEEEEADLNLEDRKWGDFDAFGVVAIDDELEDEEEDDGKTPVSDKDGTESELSEASVEEKEVEEINPSNLTQVSSDLEEPGSASSDIHTGFVKVHAEPCVSSQFVHVDCKLEKTIKHSSVFPLRDDGRLTRSMRVAFLLAKLGGAFAANLLSDLHLGTAGLNI